MPSSLRERPVNERKESGLRRISGVRKGSLVSEVCESLRERQLSQRVAGDECPAVEGKASVRRGRRAG